MKIIEKLKNRNNECYKNEPITIAVFGDSVTAGCFEIFRTGENSINTVVSEQDSYSVKLKNQLKLFYPKAQINMINAGIDGDGTASAVNRLQKDVLNFKPDLVIVMFGLNDCCVKNSKEEDYKQNLITIFTQIQKNGAECIFMTPNYINDYTRFDITDGLIKEIASDVANVYNSGKYNRFMNSAREAVKECGVTLCDVSKKWQILKECGVDTTMLLSNGINHPNKDMINFFVYSLIDTIFDFNKKTKD